MDCVGLLVSCLISLHFSVSSVKLAESCQFAMSVKVRDDVGPTDRQLVMRAAPGAMEFFISFSRRPAQNRTTRLSSFLSPRSFDKSSHVLLAFPPVSVHRKQVTQQYCNMATFNLLFSWFT